ncbi:glycosyltransferase family 2 protein [Paraburkholderia youngii]|uniref:glycosyltransferase family 2 protein n=1 Tax=Paraburkholderia youngii TaxID=2782701 RepID=UPI003D24F1A8
MTEPMISVLMPVHNGGRFIEEAVASILRQQYQNFELLIIDDGSNDETNSIATSISVRDTRVRVLRQEKSGIVAALNHGISRSNGKYLARMDADDVAHPIRLGTQLERMEAEPHLVACGSDFVKFGESTQYVSTPRLDADCKALLMIESCFAHPTVMLRAQVIKQHGVEYKADDEFVEDYRLWTDLAPYGAFANIPMPLLKYRVHKGQISTARIERQRDAHARIASEVLHVHGCPVDTSTLREFLWPKASGMNKAIPYLMGSRHLANDINATAPQCEWLRLRTRKIRLRNAVRMVTGRNS